jgi:hypothetical protein
MARLVLRQPQAICGASLLTIVDIDAYLVS